MSPATSISIVPAVTTRFSLVPGGCASASSTAAAGEAQLVELDAARLVEREQRARREAAILAGQDLRSGRAQHERTRLRARADQRRERHLERARDLPQHVDRRRALAELDLAEHRARHARDLREPLERQAAPRAQAAKVGADDGREVRRSRCGCGRERRRCRRASSGRGALSTRWLATLFPDAFFFTRPKPGPSIPTRPVRPGYAGSRLG